MEPRPWCRSGSAPGRLNEIEVDGEPKHAHEAIATAADRVEGEVAGAHRDSTNITLIDCDPAAGTESWAVNTALKWLNGLI